MSIDRLKLFMMKELKPIIIIICSVNLFRIFINIIKSVLLSEVITEATEGNLEKVLYSAVMLLSLVLGNAVLNVITATVLAKNKAQKIHNCKMKFYEFFFHKPIHLLHEMKIGDTKEKLNDDFNVITNKYIQYYPNFIMGLLSAIAYFAYLYYLNKWIALSLLFVSFLQLIPPMVIKKFLQVNYDNCRDIEAKITDFTIEGYRGFLLIKLYGLKKWWQDKLTSFHKEYSKIGRASIYTGAAEGILNDLISNILNYGTYGIIGLLILNNISTLDIGIQAIALSGSLYSAVKTSFELIKNISVCKTAEKRLFAKSSEDEEKSCEISIGNIEIKNLTYSYGENRIFSNLNLSIDSSEVTVIKGSNGCGKSTLFKLISGVIKNESGETLIDNYISSKLSASNFPEKIFYLPQNDALFNFSAYVLYGMIIPEKKESAVRLAKQFELTDTLIYESKINELSGGERKKVFLSLAFTVDPIIMMLDEPTNSLDESGKMLLKDLLKKRNGGALIITHDDFIDNLADRICTIGKGESLNG